MKKLIQIQFASINIILCLILVSFNLVAQEIPFSANDLAILLPLDSASKQPKYKITVGDQKWGILSEKRFQQVITGAKSQNIFLNSELVKAQNWYLAGLRYTPCAFFQGLPQPCKEQIRFVFQSHHSDRKLGGFDDYSMHVVYNYTNSITEQLNPRLESFRKLKNQFSGQLLDLPLSVHPILNSNAGDQYLALLKTEIIDKYVAKEIPAMITFMGLGKAKIGNTSSPHDWIFVAGSIDKSGNWQLIPLPTGEPQKSQLLKLDDENGFLTNISPNPSNVSLLRSNADSNEIALQILHPQKSGDHNVDCASCHMADVFIFPPSIFDDGAGSKEKLIQSVEWLTKDNKRLTEVLVDDWVHAGRFASEALIPRNFGYIDDRPMISQRLVLDNAEAVERSNQLYKLQTNQQCKDSAETRKVIECLYFDSSGTASLLSCMKDNCNFKR